MVLVGGHVSKVDFAKRPPPFRVDAVKGSAQQLRCFKRHLEYMLVAVHLCTHFHIAAKHEDIHFTILWRSMLPVVLESAELPGEVYMRVTGIAFFILLCTIVAS